MKYIIWEYVIPFVVVLVAFVTTSRVKKKCQRALELEKYDWGSYKLHPVTGKKAVRLAKLGILWANIFFWGIVLIVLIDVMKSSIRWWLP